VVILAHAVTKKHFDALHPVPYVGKKGAICIRLLHSIISLLVLAPCRCAWCARRAPCRCACCAWCRRSSAMLPLAVIVVFRRTRCTCRWRWPPLVLRGHRWRQRRRLSGRRVSLITRTAFRASLAVVPKAIVVVLAPGARPILIASAAALATFLKVPRRWPTEASTLPRKTPAARRAPPDPTLETSPSRRSV